MHVKYIIIHLFHMSDVSVRYQPPRVSSGGFIGQTATTMAGVALPIPGEAGCTGQGTSANGTF